MTTEINEPPRSVFDELTLGVPAGPGPTGAAVATVVAPVAPAIPPAGPPEGTPARVKQATQELLRLGALYAEAKPNLYQAVLANRTLVAAALEPLDLAFRVDEVRGLVVLVVSPSIKAGAAAEPGAGDSGPTGQRPGDPGEEWQHPLVRRQRLTLAQSLLLAILRRRYVEHEKTASGTTAARVPVDELVPELATYLGDEGSDSANQSRLRRLLDQLRDHGIVSAVDDDEQVTIRPLICHVADPTSLALLLHHYNQLTGGGDER